MGEVDLYLDASFLVALLTAEPASARADDFAHAHGGILIVSDFGAAEFASAIARRVRTRELPIDEAQLVLSAFDHWIATIPDRAGISAVDVAMATEFLRRLDLPLRTPDAIHIAIARRLGVTLATFDSAMASAAHALGVPVADI